MSRKVSIHDIAKHLNVSAATVSFVLNGKAEEKRISKELAKKVLAYVAQIGYQPNQVAKSLRTGKTKIIGMLVEDISDPFFSQISRSIEKLAYQFGYKIFYSSTENDTQKAKDLIKVFRERQVDGYIIAPPPGVEEDIQLLLKDNLPLVLFDRYYPSITTNTVVINNTEGAYNGAKHLMKSGYKNIGFVTLESDQSQMSDRLNGYLQALAEKDMKPFVKKVPYRMSHETAVEVTREFMKEHPEIDALLFATNYLTISGIRALGDLQKKIPGDVGVVGFDDNTNYNLFSPAISAVAQPMQEIAEEVISLLMSCLKVAEESNKKRIVVLSTRLIVRDSSIQGIPAQKQMRVLP